MCPKSWRLSCKQLIAGRPTWFHLQNNWKIWESCLRDSCYSHAHWINFLSSGLSVGMLVTNKMNIDARCGGFAFHFLVVAISMLVKHPRNINLNVFPRRRGGGGISGAQLLQARVKRLTYNHLSIMMLPWITISWSFFTLFEAISVACTAGGGGLRRTA